MTNHHHQHHDRGHFINAKTAFIFLLGTVVLLQLIYGSSVYNISIFRTRIFYGKLHNSRSPEDDSSNKLLEENIVATEDIFVEVTRDSSTALPTDEATTFSEKAASLSNNSTILHKPSTSNPMSPPIFTVSTSTTTNISSTVRPEPDTGPSTVTPASIPPPGTALATGLNKSNIYLFSNTKPGLPLCPMLPPNLVGAINVSFDVQGSMIDLEQEFNDSIETGGHSRPDNCSARHRVAIIIPYRDRPEQLQVFLQHMLPLFLKQQLDFTVVVVEQVQNQTFNRGKLMNVGFVEAMKLYDWQCVIFHDVDILAEDDRNIYSCPDQPRHMSVGVDKFNYRLLYPELFGGITALTKEQFSKVNGYSNDFWGWGGEDDEMASRVLLHYRISRYPTEIARYRMMKHDREGSNPINTCRHSLMYKYKSRMTHDGINSLKYKVVRRELKPLFTLVTVDLLEKQEKERLKNEGVCSA